MITKNYKFKRLEWSGISVKIMNVYEQFVKMGAIFMIHTMNGLKLLRLAARGWKARGARVVCVDIDPVEFPEWCKNNDMKLNAAARNRYANLAAYKAVTENS